MPTYVQRYRGTSRPGVGDREERVQVRAKPQPLSKSRIAKQLARAERVGVLTRLLRQRPMTVAELHAETGLNRGVIYELLQEFKGDLYDERKEDGKRATVWTWRLSWT